MKRNQILNCKKNADGPNDGLSGNAAPDELIYISDTSNDYAGDTKFSISMLPDTEEEFVDEIEAPPFEADSDCYIQDEANACQFVIKHLHQEPPVTDPDVCLMCVNGFPTHEELLRHNSECHALSTVTFKCNTCAQELKSREALKDHMLLHRPAYICVHCGATFQQSSDFARHLSQHRLHKFQCLICTDIFPCRIDLEEHKERLGHDVLPDFKCPVCDLKCNSRSSLARHLRRHNKSHKCSVCKDSFPSLRELQRHNNKHLGIKPISCELCPQRFVIKGNLRRHMHLMHGPGAKKKRPKKKNFSIVKSENEEMEGEEFMSIMGGDEVNETHEPSSETETAPEKAIQNLCTMCEKVCDSAADLEEHYIAFHKRHKCLLCDSSFKSACQLKDHTNRHKGLKTVPCSVCDQKFASAGDLKKHMNIHCDVVRLPHACPHCDATFSLISVLKNHVNQHLGIKPYKCTYCDKSFTLKGSQTIHMRTHPEYNPQLYKCELCGAVFAYHIRLKKHYALKHPKRSINKRLV